MNITLLEWSLPNVKEPHEILELTMEISKDFGWWSDIFHHNWLSGKDL
jgi:hypothetical protein